MYFVSLRNFLLVITFAKSAYGAVINSFNGLIVGPGQLNGIGNEVDVIGVHNNAPGSFRFAPRTTLSRSSALHPVSSSSTSINSFQGNIGGVNSFQNNAGISLVPTGIAATSGQSRIDQWELFRQRMQLWAAQLRARYQLFYPFYPYAYFYRNF